MKERSPGLTTTVVERVHHSGERVEIPVAQVTGGNLARLIKDVLPE